MNRPGIVLGTLLLFGTATPAHAAGMSVEPGKWEFKIRFTMPAPMGGAPRERVETHCVEEAEISPEKFMEESQECTLSDVKSDATSMSWTVTCPNPSGTMTGKARYQSTGTTVNGTMTMGMAVNGQNFEMTHAWDGKRLGPCD